MLSIKRRNLGASVWKLAGLLTLAPGGAWAQAGAPASMQTLSAPVVTPVVVDAAAAPQAAPAEPLAEAIAEPVGNSTQRLLALQRSGQLASTLPRPLPGEIAQRSRERYLKSFEREIPERFQSSVGAKSGQGAGGR